MRPFDRIRRRAVRHTLLFALVAAPVPPSAAATAPSTSSIADLDDRLARDPLGTRHEIVARLEAARAARDPRAERIATRDLFEAQLDIDHAFADRAAVVAAIDAARAGGDFETLAMLAMGDGFELANRGHAAEAIARSDEAIAVARTHGLDYALARACNIRGTMEAQQARTLSALDWLRQAYDGYARLGNALGMADSLYVTAGVIRSSVAASDDDLRQAAAYLEKADLLLRGRSYPSLQGALLGDLGLTTLRLARPREAEGYFRRALPMVGDDEVLTHVLRFRLASALLAQSRPRDALDAMRGSSAVLAHSGPRVIYAQARLVEARAFAMLGRRETSFATLDDAKAEATALANPRLDVEYYTAATNVHATFGDYREALADVQAQVANERLLSRRNSEQSLADLRVQFDVRVKDQENALLQARQVQSDAERRALQLGLALAGLVLVGGGGLLALQVRQRRRFATMALVDELTGAPNRRRIADLARVALAAHRRDDDRLWIAILDIDHFKSFNDRFGHDVGDVVLRRFFETCRRQLRPSESLGRWGGEEFLLVGRDLDATGIAPLFDRLNGALRAVPLPDACGDAVIGFSMGACEVRGETDLEAVVKRADAALYAAKLAGRGRYRIAAP